MPSPARSASHCDLCGHKMTSRDLTVCERCGRWVCRMCWCFDLCDECAATAIGDTEGPFGDLDDNER